MIEYCVGVVDQSMEQKRQALGEKVGDPAEQRKIQCDLFADEVKVSPLNALRRVLLA